MLTHGRSRRARTPGSRLVALCAATVTLVLTSVSAAVAAGTPDGEAWDADAVSPLGLLLVLVILPVGLAVVVTLLALLPSMARDRGYAAGAGWRGDAEWFGSPTRGVDAADDVTPEQLEAGSTGAGGTSGRW